MDTPKKSELPRNERNKILLRYIVDFYTPETTCYSEPLQYGCAFIYKSNPELGFQKRRFRRFSDYQKFLKEHHKDIILLSFSSYYVNF